MAAVPAIAPVTEEISGSQKAVKGKGHVVRKPKPERQETDLKIDKIKEEIGRCNARIAEIEGILRSKRNNRMAPTPESKALRDQLSALREERNEIQVRSCLVLSKELTLWETPEMIWEVVRKWRLHRTTIGYSTVDLPFIFLVFACTFFLPIAVLHW